MFCPKCGTKLSDDAKFCTGCGAPVSHILPATKPGRGSKEPLMSPRPAPTPAPQQPTLQQPTLQQPTPQPAAPAPHAPQPAAASQPPAAAPPKPTAPAAPAPKKAAPAPPKPVIDVKKIIRKPPVIVALKETLDFKGAEHALETEALKTKAFSGFFSSAQPSDVRVESLTKIYEPIHLVKATYKGIFEVVKDFNLQLDPDTVKVIVDKKVHDIKPSVATGGLFGGSSAPTLKLTGSQIVNKTAQKGVYHDLNWVEKPMLENYVTGKATVAFDPKKPRSRTVILGTQARSGDHADRVMTPQIVQRPPTFKTLMEESITVETQTVYYPKYKALVANLKNNQKKYLFMSAVDKQILPSETF